MFSRFKKSISNLTPYIFSKLNTRILVEGVFLTATGMSLDLLVPYIFGETFTLLATAAPSTSLLGIEMGPWAMVATGAAAYTLRVAVINTRTNTFAPIGPRAFQKAICDYTEHAVER